MQTEPIGFKGTEGEFILDTTVSPLTFGKAIYCDENYICHFSTFSNQQNFHNAKLMAASKTMAIALQKIEKAIDDLGLKLVDTESKLHMALYNSKHLAKEALTQAGL